MEPARLEQMLQNALDLFGFECVVFAVGLLAFVYVSSLKKDSWLTEDDRRLFNGIILILAGSGFVFWAFLNAGKSNEVDDSVRALLCVGAAILFFISARLVLRDPIKTQEKKEKRLQRKIAEERMRRADRILGPEDDPLW